MLKGCPAAPLPCRDKRLPILHYYTWGQENLHPNRDGARIRLYVFIIPPGLTAGLFLYHLYNSSYIIYIITFAVYSLPRVQCSPFIRLGFLAADAISQDHYPYHLDGGLFSRGWQKWQKWQNELKILPPANAFKQTMQVPGGRSGRIFRY